ncbi:DUF4838 domain-containing protein [Alistipes sp.]|uniref:DUF4838 domain-containing protein n=1 Tax=Alistipes sp. TaxID=1872444 RepID=UPI003AF11D9E
MNAVRTLAAALLLFTAGGASAQTVVTRNGKAVARIVVAEDTPANRTAARLLQRFVAESSGAKLRAAAKARPGDILIGAADTAGLGRDGFRLSTRDGVLRISGGGCKGTVYGAIALLERELGMTYYAAGVYDLDRRRDIVFERMDLAENPAFRYRQSQGYGMAQDSVYRLFLRLEEPRDLFAGNLWVHTFNTLLPASVYGEEHPEYYSYINGERRPGRASQWCLTNDAVFELAAAKIDSIFRANPGMDMISVSQNDSNFTYCRCEACERVNEEEGAPSGNYVRFLNRLAERFPDKQFSTLAYLFTMQPPKHVRPLPNVNIMLCDIDCDREVPLTDNASGREFIRALEGWAALTDNIFVWDYGINFDNMVAPFPNFPILGPNMELFRRNHATMHFSQIGGSYGGDFSEMRTWVVSRLMWNPEQDTDSLVRHFMRGYYGSAAPYLYQYEKLLEGALLASGQRLWIYDSPVSHKDGMLNAACRKRYNALFDRAERAVAGDSVLLRRVHLARLPLIYSDLEIARTLPEKDLGEVVRELDTFEKYVVQYGVRTLNERSNSPEEYCRLYRSRYLPSGEPSKALGARIEWIAGPAEKYCASGERTLTDGLYGGASFVESWTGWEGSDGALVVDLGCEKEFTTVEADFLHQLGQWILLPRSVTYGVSADGERYEPFGRVELAEDQSVPVKFVQATATAPQPVRARYIRVEIEGVKTCPSWHYGVGCPCWFFLDEIAVR